METVLCARCDRDKQLGHLDPDNLRWYCEDCWMEFSGKSRLCFRCRDFVPNGSVDVRDKRWYCTKCWEFYTKVPSSRTAQRGRSRSQSRYRRGLSPPRRSPPRQFPAQRVFLTPNPAILPSHMNHLGAHAQQQQALPQQQQQVLPPPQQPSYTMPQQQQQLPQPQLQQPFTVPPQQFQQHAPPLQQQFSPQPLPYQPAQQPYMQQPMSQPPPQPFMHSQPPPQPYMPPPAAMPDIGYGLPMSNSNHNGLLQPNASFLNNHTGSLLNMPPDLGPNPFSLAHLLDGPYGMKGGKKGKKGKDGGKGGKKGKNTLMLPGKGVEDGKNKLGVAKGKNGARGGFYDQPGMSPSTNSGPLPRYQGVVKGYNSKNGYGFVYCLETAAIHGRDVFIHKTQMSEALGIDLTEHPEMRNEDFEVAIEFSVIMNDKGLPQARDCWLLEDDAVRAKLMVDAGIDPLKRTGVGNPLNFADPLTEPPLQMRPPPPLLIPPPPPAVRPDDADDSDKDSSDSDKDNQSNSSDKDDSDKDDSDKDDSDKEDSDDIADHDDGDAKSGASD
eukprot:GEMP01017558.1.p1 GENE.GEMP01017558.1~~GEMP01017558.1.p1  ORF type:complete len:551 (-),score=182.46 GEMP01017558.1:878-2530(-)